MKDYRLIAFDLDGTLTDPASGLVKSFAYALDRMHVNYGDRKNLLQFIGPPLHDEWKRVYGFSEEEADRALAYFHEYFSVKGWCDNRVYDGIPEMLGALRSAGKKMILATSKPENFAKMILDLFSLTPYFDGIYGAAGEKVRDKKWEVLAYGLSYFPDVPKTQCILVGDRKYDAEGAAVCGIDSLGVLYGHGTAEELAAAPFTAVVDTVAGIVDFLCERVE